MIISNKGFQKLIASGLALLFTLSAMCVMAWALLSTEQMGLSVSVSYTSPVTAKVYLATNSSAAGAFRQISPTVNVDPLTDFDTSKAALIFNTYDSDTNGGLNKTAFEALGAGNGLKCDASGEMEFYVYVENYSLTDKVYYKANITFTNENGFAPFSVISKPDFITAETALEVTVPSISLLIFKIKSDNLVNANGNTLQIEIILQTTMMLSISSLSKYTSGNYNGLYYIDFGEYPQTSVGATQPVGTVYNSTSGYYENAETGEKYAKKSEIYYKVEPVRWLIIGNGKNLSGLPNKNFDNLTDNQLLLLSQKNLIRSRYYSKAGFDDPNVAWLDSELYKSTLPILKNKIFNNKQLNMLGDIFEKNVSGIDYYSKISLLSYNMSFLYSNYCSASVLKRIYTDYCGESTKYQYGYWLKNNLSFKGNDAYGGTYSVVRAINGYNGTASDNQRVTNTDIQVRPIIILQCDYYD